HNPVAPGVQGELHHGAPTGGAYDHAVVGGDRSVVELDPGLQTFGGLFGHVPGDLRQVGLGHLIGGVGEPVGQVAVVGEQQQAFSLIVQPAHVEQPCAAVGALQEVPDAAPTLGVGHGGHDLGRFVEHHVLV